MSQQRVLISLVGEQPTPNLIPLFAAKPEERAECVQFLVSANERIGKVAKHLREAIQRDSTLAGVQVAEPDPSINAWDLEKAHADCEHVIQKYIDDDDAVTVNLTGGTKIMSLAAQQAASHQHVPAIYVNSERDEIIHFNGDGQVTTARPFEVRISIETQLRAAGREFKAHPQKPRVRPGDIPPERAAFATYIADRYAAVHENLIRTIVRNARRAGQAVAFTPQGQAIEAARRAEALGLWRGDEAAGTITIPDKPAFEFLNGGWVETLALKQLGSDGRFNEVLGNVEIEGFKGELDVVAARNGRLGIIECKTSGPGNDEGMSFAVAKVRLHEVILGGPYAAALFALASDENIRDWREICAQYHLPEPVYGSNLKHLSDELIKRFNP